MWWYSSAPRPCHWQRPHTLGPVGAGAAGSGSGAAAGGSNQTVTGPGMRLILFLPPRRGWRPMIAECLGQQK
jgi:hypothetical protein